MQKTKIAFSAPMFNAMCRFYHPSSQGQRDNRILGTLFFLSAISLEISEHDLEAFGIFSALSGSFFGLGVMASDRINKVVMLLSAAIRGLRTNEFHQ